jgi:predicted  nucleic acid-binding Zn-ribbon protein
MDQLSWNTSNRDTRSVEYTQLTAALDVAEEQEAVLASEVAGVAETIKEGAEEPITEDILLTASMLQTRIAVLLRKSGRP